MHPSRKFLYAVGEVGEFGGEKTGAVSAFTIDAASGSLSLLNQQSSRGQGPCYVTVDRAGKNALVANYGSGSVACLPIGGDGRLAPASSFIQHAGVERRPAAAAGSRTRIPSTSTRRIGSPSRPTSASTSSWSTGSMPGQGTLIPNEPPFAQVAPGSGPRHFAFHPDGRHAYVINEMLCTVTAFDYDPAAGRLSEIQTVSTLPSIPRAKGYSTAEVQVHPSGKFLYGSNRGHDTHRDLRDRRRAAAGSSRPGTSRPGGRPRETSASTRPGRYLLAANQDSGTVVVFRIDPQTGQLQPTGQKVEVPESRLREVRPAG